MLTRHDAEVAMVALTQLYEAATSSFRIVRQLDIAAINAAIPQDGPFVPIESDDLPGLIDEAERANRVRLDTIYRALNAHLNDESVK